MKIEDIMNLTVGERAKLSRSELAEVVSTLSSVANKRLKRLNDAGLTRSNALQYIETHGGKFSTKNKSVVDLDIEYQRVTDFLRAKTSTVAGAKKSIAEQDKAAANWFSNQGIADDYENWSDAKKKRFWSLMNGKQMQHAIEQYYGNYKGRDAIRLAAQIFEDYEAKKGAFAGYHRGAMKGSTKTFRDVFTAMSRAAYEEGEEAEAAEAEAQAALMAGLYGEIEEE